MKRLFTLLSALFTFLTATAQVENSIIFDQSSFRAVQTDALTGANIDPIAMDSSRNACARVKIKFANMNHAEVDALELKFRSNTDLAKRKVADYFDNVLILEMTAKPNTRFYVVSPDYGESNEVNINLESNKEYEMIARLNKRYSIVVSSNMPDVKVYLDGSYQGDTDKNNQLSIHNLFPGPYHLRLQIGNDVAEQNIVVHRNSIAFKVDINLAAPTQTYSIVVMSNMPDVEVFVDGNYKGATDSNCQLSILDIVPGNHILRFKFGSSEVKQNIVVHRSSIAFRQDIDLAEATVKTYKVGDYYNENGKEGVVFEVSADGKHGKIVSMKQSVKKLQWSSDSYEQRRLIGANSETDGAYNMLKVKSVSGWERKYPVFKWCADLGEGWYLPAIEELKMFTLKDAIHDAVNRTLISKGGAKLHNRRDRRRLYGVYWSSTECKFQFSCDGEYTAWYVEMDDYPSSRADVKSYGRYFLSVRAVSAF